MDIPLPKSEGMIEGIVNAMQTLSNLDKTNLENKYYAPNIQSEIGYRNSMTKGQDITNQYAPRKNELANDYKALQNQYYGPNIQSEIASRNALTQEKNISNRFDPEKYRLANEHSQQVNQFYPQMTEADIESKKAMANFRNMGGGAAGTGMKDLNDMSRALKQEHPTWTNDQILDARNQYFDGADTFSDGTPLPPPSGGVRTLLGSSYKRRTDAGQRSQERYADTLETAIKSADKNIKSAIKYSGLLGKGRGGEDRLTSLLGGESSDDFKNFNNFVKVDVPTIAGEYMRQLGVNASDEQKRMYKEVVNPINWMTDPKTALSQWEYFKKLAKNVGGTIAKDPYQRNAELRNNNKSENISDENVQQWGRDANGKAVRL